MPMRVTRSYSRRGMFGGRVRYTVSQSIGTSNVVHWSGKDLLEMQRALAEQRQHVVTGFQERKAHYAADMGEVARWLHHPILAPILAVVTLVSFIVLGATGSQALGSVLTFLFIALLAVPAIFDWWGFTTFHGHLNWSLLKFDHPTGFWWAVIGLCLVFYVFPIAYYVQAWRMAPAVKEAEWARIRAEIARLEGELHPDRQPQH